MPDSEKGDHARYPTTAQAFCGALVGAYDHIQDCYDCFVRRSEVVFVGPK